MKMRRVLSILVIGLLLTGTQLFAGGKQEAAAPEAKAVTAENVLVTNDVASFACDPAEMFLWAHWRGGVLIYDGLTYPAEGGVKPHLAESWEALDTESTSWEFKLREGILFHDGSEMNADDVVFSFERMMTLGTGAYTSVEPIESVVAIDDYTVQIDLKRPVSVFPTIIWKVFILNKDLVMQHLAAGDYGEMGDYGVEWLRFHDAGSGPYTLAEYKVNTSAEYDRYANYFLGWPNYGEGLSPIETIRILALVEPAAAKNLVKKPGTRCYLHHLPQ